MLRNVFKPLKHHFCDTDEPTPRKPTTNTDLDPRSTPIKTIFRQQPAYPRPRTQHKEGSDGRISKSTGPIQSNQRKRHKIPTKPIDQLDRRNRPRRRIILLAGNNYRLYKSHTMKGNAPQGNEIRASEDPRAILGPTSVQIRHDQRKLVMFRKSTLRGQNRFFKMLAISKSAGALDHAAVSAVT